MSDATVFAAHKWHTNGHLIADVAQLGYLRADDATLDPTYGRGTWWKVWRPLDLTTHDLAADGVDFRALPYADETFDAVAYDPPYVAVGRYPSDAHFHQDVRARYGVNGARGGPDAVQQVIDDGLTEQRRVVRRGGVVLVKCQDYIWSGFWPGTHHTLTHALALGFRVVDRFEHLGPVRPQPEFSNGKRRVQRHARRNVSTLFVLRKPKRP